MPNLRQSLFNASRAFALIVSTGAAMGALGTPAIADGQRNSVNQILNSIGAEPTRGIDTDICYPSSSEEYEALGKNAILMVKASVVVSTELPLRTVYAIYKGARIPLARVKLLEKVSDPATGGASQVSFYLLPIRYMKADTDLRADFAGERKGFGFHSFSAKAGLGKGAPAFARLDEYDTPGDADPTALEAILVREYPQYVH